MSFTTFLLTRAGIKCLLYDFDNYEEFNLAGQLCTVDSIGKNKAVALQELVRNLTGDIPMVNTNWYKEDSEVHYIMFACFDSFSARKLMFNKWKDYLETLDKESEEYKKAIFIDLRCSPDIIQVVTIIPDRIEKYSEYIWNDSEASPTLCSYKQTSHCTAMVASIATSIFTNHMSNYALKEVFYSVPLFYEHNLLNNGVVIT